MSKQMKKRRFDEGGDVERKEFASGFNVDKDYPSSKRKPKSSVKNYGDEADAGPKEDTSAVSGRADPMSKRMPSDEQKTENAKNLAKELVTTAALGAVGKGIQTVGRVGEAVRVAPRTYAERQRFLKQSEKEYNRQRGELDAGREPTTQSNIYGKRGMTGQEVTRALSRKVEEKGYAKGGSVRGHGCEQRGKTKGKFV